MIPQRNLSTLANRLAVPGAHRIPEAVLDRDYCLAWFLVGLSTTGLASSLAFKGGTALKRVYFGGYRFSEDLDFTVAVPLTEGEILKGVEAACRQTQALSAVAFVFERVDRRSHQNSFTFFMKLLHRSARKRVQESRTSAVQFRPCCSRILPIRYPNHPKCLLTCANRLPGGFRSLMSSTNCV